MTKVIQVKNLTREYTVIKKQPGLFGAIRSLFKPERSKVAAVRSITFEVERGEMVGFIGPNGAGKTTTLKMISGLLHPTSGELTVLGHKPYDRNYDFLGRMSLLLGQKSQLWWDLPPIESFKVARDIYGLEEKEFKINLDEFISLLEVANIMNIPVRKLSLGERMRCELLLSLLHKPELLLLDEPTIGLDIIIQKKIRAFLKKYNEKEGSTILLTSHYMEDVRELCKRLIIINYGELVYDGDISSLIEIYGNEKYLRVTFENEVKQETLNKYGKVIEYSPTQVLLATTRAEHAKVASALLGEFEIDDMDIQEPRLEDVIERVFEKGRCK